MNGNRTPQPEQLLEAQDRPEAIRRDEIRKHIRAGLEALDRGEGVDGERFFDELMADL